MGPTHCNIEILCFLKRNMPLIILLNVIQTTIVRDESSDLFTVLDQLHTNTLPDGRVRLFGLNTNFLKDYAFSMRSTTKRISFQGCSQMSFFVVLIMPFLLASVIS